MRVYITGITGFVGSHLTDLLLSQVEIHGLVRWRSSKDNIQHCLNKVNLHLGDLLDPHSLRATLKQAQPDVIFHLAAESLVPYSFNAPVSTLSTNCIGTCNLLETICSMKDTGELTTDPIIHICGSGAIYGKVPGGEITENAPIRPTSPYAVSKACQDMLGLQYHVSRNLKTIRSRMFTHTGPRHAEVFVVPAFAKQIAEIEAGTRQPVIHVGDLSSTRNFMDARDAVKAYWYLVNKCEYGEVYNISGGETMSIKDMLDRLLSKTTRKGIEIREDPALLRSTDVATQIPNSDKFRKLTRWEPTIPFDVTLQDTLDYWRSKVGV